MGAFIVNVNARSDDRRSIETSINALKSSGVWITEPKNGWITIYEERASSQDDDWIRHLSEQISNTIKAPVIAFLVHDSDVFCYWLFDRGRLLDEFNSCPDYFGDDSEIDASQVQGKPEVLLNYCVEGTQLEAVRQVLEKKGVIFVEEQLSEVAKLLGIDGGRATIDYRNIEDEIDPKELEATFVGTKSSSDVNPRLPRVPTAMPGQGQISQSQVQQITEMMKTKVQQMFGIDPSSPPPDPLTERLIQAVSQNDVVEIDKLVAAGANVNAVAPYKPTANPPSWSAKMLAGIGMSYPVSPLMVALANKHVEATKRLLELGANADAGNPFLGSPLHVAVSSGDVQLVRLVLDAGGDINALNAQRQTPLQSIQQIRQMFSQIGQIASKVTSLQALGGMTGNNMIAQWGKMLPSSEALDECERLLREYDKKS